MDKIKLEEAKQFLKEAAEQDGLIRVVRDGVIYKGMVYANGKRVRNVITAFVKEEKKPAKMSAKERKAKKLEQHRQVYELIKGAPAGVQGYAKRSVLGISREIGISASAVAGSITFLANNALISRSEDPGVWSATKQDASLLYHTEGDK